VYRIIDSNFEHFKGNVKLAAWCWLWWKK